MSGGTTMERAHPQPVSSGIARLDSLLGNLSIGDNVLWYEEESSLCSPFCLQFIRASLADRKPTVYVSFDRSPKNVVSFLGPLAENQHLTVLDCFTNGKGDRSEVFSRFYEKDGAQWPYRVIRVNDPADPAQVAEAIYGLHAGLSGDTRFIVDSLTGMQDLWGGEEPTLKFYARTCPRLYELDTIAYWIIEKNAHSGRLKANINKIAQVVIDLAVKNGRPSLRILKAEERQSRHLNEPQTFSCEGMEVSFEQPRLLPGSFDLGARIRVVRARQGISQRELAEKAGVTPSSISQVEKNQIFPSLPALFRLAEGLSVPVGAFFEGQTETLREGVFPAGSGLGVDLVRGARGVIEGERLLPPGLPGAGVEACLLRIQPGGRLHGHFFQHRGEEIGCMLGGRLHLRLHGQVREMGPGDAVYLRRETPERWENAGGEVAELFWVRIG